MDIIGAKKCKECGAPEIRARGLCGACYQRARAHGDIATAKARCKASGCDGIPIARGYCQTHLKRFQRHGHINDTRPADWGERSSHPLYETWQKMRDRYPGSVIARWDEFWAFVEDVGERPSEKHSLVRKTHHGIWGPKNVEWREDVPRTPSEHAEYMRQWRREKPEYWRSSYLKNRFGITLAQYEQLLAEQGGGCAICGGEEVSIHATTKRTLSMAVDHDHGNGRVRGILCANCNKGLGSFRDDVTLLQRAIAYLKEHAA